jgi:hypothetical protein
MMLAILGLMATSCGLADDCPGMPSGATCCDGVHYCEAGKTCNNSNGTCVSGGGGTDATCTQDGGVEYFTQNCHKTSGGIEFVGAPWPQKCGTCPAASPRRTAPTTSRAAGRTGCACATRLIREFSAPARDDVLSRVRATRRRLKHTSSAFSLAQ